MGVTPLMAAGGVGVRNINFGSNRSPDFEGDAKVEEKVVESLKILLARARTSTRRSRTSTGRTCAHRTQQLDDES